MTATSWFKGLAHLSYALILIAACPTVAYRHVEGDVLCGVAHAPFLGG